MGGALLPFLPGVIAGSADKRAFSPRHCQWPRVLRSIRQGLRSACAIVQRGNTISVASTFLLLGHAR